MYGNLLPKTGMATVGIGVAGTSLSLPMPIVIASVGLGIVILGVTLVRFGFRRQKGVGQA